MKTVKFKDLPEKVRNFLQRKYGWKNSVIGLKTLHTLREWSKATREERLAYAEWKYPIGTKYVAVMVSDISSSVGTHTAKYAPIADTVAPEGNTVEVGMGYVYSDATGWAEIVSESEQGLAEDSEPTFKAGDEVEVSHDGLIYNDENYFFTGGTTAKGLYICEGASKNGALYAFQHIRKPAPDKKYRAMAKEIIGNARVHEFTSIEYITVESAESMLIEALKKGKEL